METTLKVKLISHTLNPELVIATAGKLCYSPSNIDDLMEKQTDESIERFVNMITSIGHGSVLEHTSFTFGIEGVSRSLTHQLVRHRIASYSQQSQRYVKETQFEYVMPQDIKNNPILEQSYKKHMEDSQRLYDEIVDKLINYGSLFIGELSAEVFGDYVSGTNHTLPTQKAARYTGGVWVGTFIKTCTTQRLSQRAVDLLAPVAHDLAIDEGLYAHANAAKIRMK